MGTAMRRSPRKTSRNTWRTTSSSVRAWYDREHASGAAGRGPRADPDPCDGHGDADGWYAPLHPQGGVFLRRPLPDVLQRPRIGGTGQLASSVRDGARPAVGGRPDG